MLEVADNQAKGADMNETKQRTYAVRDEYAPRFGRQVLTLWSGGFADDYEGEAVELPGHNGYMVQLSYSDPIRVECESPRTDRNYLRVDAALNAALAR